MRLDARELGEGAPVGVEAPDPGVEPGSTDPGSLGVPDAAVDHDLVADLDVRDLGADGVDDADASLPPMWNGSAAPAFLACPDHVTPAGRARPTPVPVKLTPALMHHPGLPASGLGSGPLDGEGMGSP